MLSVTGRVLLFYGIVVFLNVSHLPSDCLYEERNVILLICQIAICCSEEQVHNQIQSVLRRTNDSSSDESEDESNPEDIPKKGRYSFRFYAILFRMDRSILLLGICLHLLMHIISV